MALVLGTFAIGIAAYVVGKLAVQGWTEYKKVRAIWRRR